MNTPQAYIEYYQKLSTAELLSILENSSDYLPEAVDAAKAELSRRQLSDDELNETRETVIQARLKKEKDLEQIRTIERKFQKGVQKFFGAINPIQTGNTSAETIIRLIGIIFGFIFLIRVIRDLDAYLAFWEFRFNAIALLVLNIILPGVAVVFFWMRRKPGWILLTIFIVYNVTGYVMGMVYSLSWSPSNYAGLDPIFRPPSIISLLPGLLFWSANLYALCRPQIRETFSVEKNTVFRVIVITSILSVVLNLFLVS